MRREHKPGRKVGKIAVRLKRERGPGAGRAEVSFDLQLDDRGHFHAMHEGAWYSAETKVALAEKLRAAVEVSFDLEWTRYLVVSYRAEAFPVMDDGRPAATGQYESLGVGDDRSRIRSGWNPKRSYAVTSIDLKWSVCELSQPFSPPESPDKSYRMSRDVDHQGDVMEHRPTQVDAEIPGGYVVWTAERQALLVEIVAAIGKLDARLAAMFAGGAEDLARRLDAVEVGRLLGPGGGDAPGV